MKKRGVSLLRGEGKSSVVSWENKTKWDSKNSFLITGDWLPMEGGQPVFNLRKKRGSLNLLFKGRKKK